MKILKQLRALIYDSTRKINERVFLLLTIVAFGILAVALVGDMIYQNSIVEILTIIVLMFIVAGTTVLGVKKDKLGLISKIVSVVMMIAIPVIFLFTGGAEGAAILWLVFYYMYIGLVLTGLWRVINLIILTIVVIALFVFEYTHPELVKEQVRWIFYLDTSLAVIEIGFVCFIMTWFQNRLFNIENQKAREETRKVEDLNKTQNRFFSSMSHEIRTPINTILGLNEIILRQEDASEEIRKDAENIHGAGRMLLALINDILDFSKIKAGRMDIVPVNYNTASMISEIVNMMWLRAEEKGLELKIEVDPSVPSELFGDEVRIKQILINLLNNAVKYTQKGSVTLHIEKEEINDNRVLLMMSVIDTGIGIKQDAIPYLFDAFQRLDEENNSKIEGTGLGLSIVKQLVELMDGKVTVNSVYTQGSTFAVTLWQKISRYDPVGNISIESLNKGTSDSAYEPSFKAKDVRILIVDDNEMNLEVERKLLSGTGVITDTVLSGEEALTRTMSVRYDMILMDHIMPRMDGIECLQLIRKQTGGLNNHVPVIVLTANAGGENRELYVNAGFDGYLIKPVTGYQLEESILLHVPGSKLVKNKDRSDVMVRMNTAGGYSRKIPVLISASSTCDIPPEIMKAQQMNVIPYNITIDGKVYYDAEEAGTDELLRYMKAGREFSAEAPSIEEYEAFFGRELKKAHNIIYVSVTSPMNIEYERASKAAGSYGNVFVFDSGLASGGAGLLVLAAKRMSMQGKAPEKIIEELEKLKGKIISYFVTNGIYFQSRKGLLAQGIYSIIQLLGIHPFLRFSFGKLSVRKASVGDDKTRCYEKFVDYALPRSIDPDRDILMVTYSDLSAEELELIKTRIKNRFDFKKIVFVKGSATLILTSGSGSFGITYFNKKTDLELGLNSLFGEDDDIWGSVDEIEDIDIEETVDGEADTDLEEAVKESKWYDELPGIDAKKALEYNGSEDTLKNMMKMFYESVDQKNDELKRFFEDENWKDYTVKVHALKSSARLIGAEKLADDAQKLEDAGKREDAEYIKSHNGDFLDRFVKYKEVLGLLFERKEAKKADGYLIEITYDTIRSALKDRDEDILKETFDEIMDYELPREDALKIEQLKDLFIEGDYETMEALMD